LESGQLLIVIRRQISQSDSIFKRTTVNILTWERKGAATEMNETSFEKLLKKLGGIRDRRERFFTWEDLESMTSSQLSKLTLEMMRFTGLGTYSLLPELFDLIEYLDKTVSIPEDPNLEKYLHMTASLVCLTQFEGSEFDMVLPVRLAKHLERIIGPDPFKVPSMEMQPSLQIATFLAYPLLEGVIRRKLPNFMSPKGQVLREFQVPGRTYKPGERISNLYHELQIIEKESTSPSLKAKLSCINELQPLFQEIRKWRNSLLHGELTASWHSITLFLLTCLILLEA